MILSLSLPLDLLSSIIYPTPPHNTRSLPKRHIPTLLLGQGPKPYGISLMTCIVSIKYKYSTCNCSMTFYAYSDSVHV